MTPLSSNTRLIFLFVVGLSLVVTTCKDDGTEQDPGTSDQGREPDRQAIDGGRDTAIDMTAVSSDANLTDGANDGPVDTGQTDGTNDMSNTNDVATDPGDARNDTADAATDAGADAGDARVDASDAGADASDRGSLSNIVVYSTTSAGNMGGRSGADAICDLAKANHPALAGYSSRALVCANDPTDVQNFPTLLGVPAAAPIVSLNGTLLAADWAAFMVGLQVTLRDGGVLATATGTSSQFFTGCKALSGMGCIYNCQDFTSTSPLDSACVGRTNRTDDRWIATGNILSCDVARHVLCIAYEPSSTP